MYQTLLAIHNVTRWLVLISLIFSVFISTEGLITKRAYISLDKVARGFTSGLSHIQLLIGLLLYAFVSPITQSFFQNGAKGNDQLFFFGVTHVVIMILAVIIITVGASMAKRASENHRKFKVTLICFSIALIMILSAIPWYRPFIRAF